nr:MAG TPA: hypothetical protein [Caudoviricetes sp.]DAP47468.1 MAG TPA: hypothetical protein [Caudoviricetes sp.]
MPRLMCRRWRRCYQNRNLVFRKSGVRELLLS